MASASTPRIVNLSEQRPDWRWLHHAFETELPDWHHVSSLAMPQRVLGAREARWRAARQAARLLAARPGEGILISHGPRPAAFWHLFAPRTRTLAHEVYSFNFTEMPEGLARRVYARAFRDVSRFVVSSQLEREYYAGYFEIPVERIEFRHWGVQPPPAVDEAPLIDGEYVCALGSQARDYATLVSAARSVPGIRFVIVGGAGAVDTSTLPANVEFRSRIPFRDATNIMRHGLMMVLPMNSTTARCGHVTAVAALHMGVPIVSTECRGLSDYLIDGHNARIVPQSDPRAMAEAVTAFLDDPVARRDTGAAGAAFARRFCTEESVIAGFRESLARRGVLGA